MNAESTDFTARRSALDGPKIIAFPRGGIPYNECLYAAVERSGVRVVDGVWSGRWLDENVARGDVVHVHWPSFLYFHPGSTHRTYRDLLRFVALLDLIRRRGARIAWTAHNLYPHDGGRRELAHRIARRIMASRADVVLAHGPTAAAIVSREFGIRPDRIRVTNHGHFIDFHRGADGAATARARLGIAADRYVYAFVGLCKPYKNLELLIETFARIGDESLLLIAGHFQSAAYRARIHALLAKLPADRWQLRDAFIANDDIHRYVLAGDVLVLPYAEILTSGSAMLGLSFGRPVVAPDMGGLRDMIDAQCGVLYEPGDPGGLLDALRRVRHMTFSEQSIIEHARRFDWLDAAGVVSRLLGA